MQKLLNIEETAINKQANQYAQQNLVPSSCWEDLHDNYIPLNDAQICRYSNQYRIHLAIILGRLCFEKDYYGVKTNIDKTIG